MANQRTVSWQMLVVERILAVLEMLGIHQGSISWDFNKNPNVTISIARVGSDRYHHTVVQRLKLVDGTRSVTVIEVAPLAVTISVMLKEPEIRELHIVGGGS